MSMETIESHKNFDTLIIRFSEPISEIDKMFSDREAWSVSSLEEWCNSFESTRFTQIESHSAVITSEYNMEYVSKWLKWNTDIVEMKQS